MYILLLNNSFLHFRVNNHKEKDVIIISGEIQVFQPAWEGYANSNTRWIVDPDPFQNVTDPEHYLAVYLVGVWRIFVVSFWRQMEYKVTNQMSILRCSQTVDESSLLEGTGTITQCFSNKRKNLFTVFLQGDF